jgi:hypothetical protein
METRRASLSQVPTNLPSLRKAVGIRSRHRVACGSHVRDKIFLPSRFALVRISTLNYSLTKSRDFLLVAGILILILGVRIFIGNRFVAGIPQWDDTPTLWWLQKWSQGTHDLGFIFQRHNGHPMELYFLANLGQFLMNGYWDGRLDFLVYAFVHTAYAAVVIATFGNILTSRDRGWLLLFIFVLFAVPFGGYEIGWGFLWPDTAMMLFGIGALYVSVYHGQSWVGVASTVLLAALASVNIAAGCLCALMVTALTLFRAALVWRVTSQDLTIAIVCLTIFLVQYLTLPVSSKAGFLEGTDAFLKALAWPVVFIPGIGLLTLVPLVGLILAQLFLTSFRQKNTAFVTGVGGLMFLAALATGAFRGENNNMGMPSGRYTDIFIIVPLFCAVGLCLLYRGCTGRYKLALGIFAWVWAGLQVLGFSIHFLYRTLPFMAVENGEWNEPAKQVLIRDVIRGSANAQPFNDYFDDPLFTAIIDVMNGKVPMPAMTIPMMIGFPLQAGSQGNYVFGGYHPSYRPRPTQLYWGSFDPKNAVAVDKWFVSGPFKPQAPYITIDLLVDKKSRFNNYHLDGLQLVLVDETTGQREQLLPQLSHTFPYIFRDWELIYARVTPGDSYRIESSDKSPIQWIAFGEPFESGRLTPLIVGLCQSGKLLCLCGLGLLLLVAGCDWVRIRQDPAKAK